jgi:phytoene dehydrogenase-like protein
VSTAIVVGAGPNGLAAAVRLAQHGIDVEVLEAADVIGGGTRTSELTVPGVLHDHCSAFHPMGVGSPYLRTLGLERYGLRWRWPEIDCAHPLDSGEAGLLWRSVDRTAQGLGADGERWRRAFAGVAAGFDDLAEDVMRPVVHVPRHPLRLLRFGPPALLPAAVTATLWQTDKARALFGGVAAHAFHPLHRPGTSAIGLTIISAGHRHGWPVAEGGSRSITDALAGLLADLGGKIQTGVRVRSARDLPPADAVLLDLAPGAVADVLGDGLPWRVARAYRRFRHGPGAFKVDLAIDGDVPWRDPVCARAGTVHLGGTFAEIAATERDIARGRMPERPFVLVGQQYVADASRSAGSINPLWAYAHVPHGYSGDATAAILDQIERFAPGFRDCIVAQTVRPTREIAADNPNYVGGDIVGGANTLRQLIMRPRIASDPYDTGVPGAYICSAASPPGAGAHGMCGYHAAGSALRHLHITPERATPSQVSSARPTGAATSREAQ